MKISLTRFWMICVSALVLLSSVRLHAENPMDLDPYGLKKRTQQSDSEYGITKPFLSPEDLESSRQREEVLELERLRRSQGQRKSRPSYEQDTRPYQQDRIQTQNFERRSERQPNRPTRRMPQDFERRDENDPTRSEPTEDVFERDLQEERRQIISEMPRPQAQQSRIEEIFSGRFPEQESRLLKQFGYDLFNQAPSTFTPLGDIPISSDYVVGPGDIFTVNVWGSANFAHTVKVNREGMIFIPKIGRIKVWGKTFSEMASTVRSRLSNFFSGIKVDIALESIRMLDVYIIGEVERPGSYSIPSTATPINALFYAGGPSKKGSLRKVQVLRNNKVITEVDLYKFLVDGSHEKQKLQSQDVILVPVVGRVAAVSGQMKRPAIYELNEETTVFDTLKLAGGLSFTGTTGRLSVERINENKERVVNDYQIPKNIGELSRADAIKSELGAKVLDGDFITIFPILEGFSKTVFLRGHVKRPGKYEFKEGMKLTDLIPSFELLQPAPYEKFVQIVRTIPPKDEKESIFTSLKAALEGDESANMPLKEKDEVYVFSKEELNLRERVSIDGKVNRPGEYFYFPGMTLKDLVFMAGNLTMDAYRANAEIARYTVTSEGLDFNRLKVDLQQALSTANNNPKLQPKDRVFVRGLPQWELENFITLTGEVQFPGRYSYFGKERLSNVIERAGGFTDTAFLKGAVFTRRSVKELQKQSLDDQIAHLEKSILQEQINPSELASQTDRQMSNEAQAARESLLDNLKEAKVTGRMVINIQKLSKFKGSKHDIRLKPGDALHIPDMPSVVNVMGEVYSATSFVFESDQDVKHYLRMAGGPTINADTDSIFVIKADGRVVSRRQDRGFLLRNFYQYEIERGDTVLVPKDISQFSWLQTTKDLTDIIFKIATTTGITIQAFK